MSNVCNGSVSRLEFFGVTHGLATRFNALLMLALLTVGIVGCNRGEKIAHYQVPREITETAAPPADDQMLVGLGLHADMAWFFKLVGTKEQIAVCRGEFETFLDSIQFEESGSSVPQWQIPEDWKRLPGNSFRFATYGIEVEGETLEVAISNLAAQGDVSEYLRINVDRWRREMGLGPSSPSQPIEESLTELEKSVGRFFLLELEGRYSGGAMGGRAPFASGGQPPMRNVPSPSPTSAPQADVKVNYDLPEGWTEAEQTRDSQVSIEKQVGEDKAIMTVTGLAIGAGDWGANVMRWRRQLGLAPIADQKLEEVTEKLVVDGSPAQLIRIPLEGEDADGQAIVGVMLIKFDQVWFVRYSGAKSMVEQEEAAFQTLLASLKFEQK